MQYNPQQETIIYKTTPPFTAASRYQNDLKRRQKQGWRLVSCTESGRDFFGRVVLTAIYERGNAAPGPALPQPYPPVQQPGPMMNVQNVPLLLSMLSVEERAGFEGEMQAVVNRWLARKASH